MKEFDLYKSSLIGGWFIDEKVCDLLLDFKNKNLDKFEDGKLIGGYDPNVKKSKDFYVGINDFIYPFDLYREELNKCIHMYRKKYEFVDGNNYFGICENYNFQYYKPGEGFKNIHFENTFRKNDFTRILVFMTYLNDVEDGGTHFPYQDLITPCKKGLTLVWPAGFTHPHKGQISNTKEKFIITGWLNGIELVKDVQRIYLR